MWTRPMFRPVRCTHPNAGHLSEGLNRGLVQSATGFPPALLTALCFIAFLFLVVPA